MLLIGSFVHGRPSSPVNGGFEIAPPFTAVTTSGNVFIDGTASGTSTPPAYRWAIPNGAIAASASASFDSAVSYAGNYSLKLDLANATGSVTVGSFLAANAAQLFVLLPNTRYTLSAKVKTNNTATNGAFIDLREFNSSFAAVTTTSSNKLSGTNDWTTVTVTVTTQPSTAWGGIFLRHNVTGNTATAWFDNVKVTRS